MDDSVQQRPAVVAEGRAAVGVRLELVTGAVVLCTEREKKLTHTARDIPRGSNAILFLEAPKRREACCRSRGKLNV